MNYVGNIYRPPSEAYSLLLQVTVGCSHNKCTFCNMFIDKKFYVKNIDEVLEDLREARNKYKFVDKIFLCDGDALCLSNKKLLVILQEIKTLFPECKRVGVYGSPLDVLHKTPEELVELYDNGIGIIYIGAESGDDEILKRIRKGVSSEELIKAVHMIEDSGIKASVTFISGMGGKKNWKSHAINTGKMISKMNASYVSLLTLMLDENVPLYEEIKSGEFEVLSPKEVVEESYLLLKNTNPTRDCVFRSNHASNYISLRGDLPADTSKLLSQLESAMDNLGILKSEWMRAL